MEARNVSQLKATVFSKKIHSETLLHLEAYISSTDVLHRAVKCAGHLLSGQILAAMKGHDENLKALRVYSVSVHAANLVLNKLNRLSPRERAAKLREPLGVIFLLGRMRMG